MTQQTAALAGAPAATQGDLPIVRLSGAIKTYGQTNAIDNVDLDIPPRELFTLLGPSGSVAPGEG